jgi:hypothetical protein
MRGQYLEVGKNVPLGQAEPLRGIPPVAHEVISATLGVQELPSFESAS